MNKNKIKQEIADIRYFLKSDIEDYINKSKAGYFPIPLLVFTLVNYLAALWSGKSYRNENETINFIKKYFGSKYQGFPGIIYIIYRHGVVHERMPKIIQLRKKGRIISWYITRNALDKKHLKPAIVVQSNGKKRPVIYFSIKSLIQDLIIALDSFERELLKSGKNGTKLRKNFIKVWKIMREPKDENFLLAKYPYLNQKEFDNLRREVSNCSFTIKGS